jgi:hypothetical protein
MDVPLSSPILLEKLKEATFYVVAVPTPVDES